MHGTVERELATPKQHGAVAKPFDGGRVVRDEEDRAAALLEGRDDAEALPLEALVPDGEDLVEEEHVRLEECRDGEAEPHGHARRVRPDGPVDRVLELSERDDLVEALANPRACQPLQHPVQLDILPAREVGMEACPELQQRADPAAGRDPARRRLDDPRDQPQQGRLPRAVASDEPDRLAGRHGEREVAKRPDLLRARPPAGDEQLLQRVRLACPDDEPPGDAVDLDLARSHSIYAVTAASSCRTIPAITATNAGSAFGISMRENRRPSVSARCAASTSRSHLISR